MKYVVYLAARRISCIVLVLQQQVMGKKKGQKSGQKKKNNKNKMSQRKNNKKSNLPQGDSDLSAKLYSTMEKHKEVSDNCVLVWMSENY